MGGFGGLGNSDSTTSTKTLQTNQQIQASENAVIQANRHSNNTGPVKLTQKYNVAKGGTLTITNGMSDEAFQEYVRSGEERINQLLEAKQNPDGSEGPVPADVLSKAINDRLKAQAEDNIKNAPARDKANKIKAGAIVAAILIIAVLALTFGKKKKGTA